MLHPGLYEQLINNALTRELAEIPAERQAVAPLDRAEASKVLGAILSGRCTEGLGQRSGQRRGHFRTNRADEPNRHPHSKHHTGS